MHGRVSSMHAAQVDYVRIRASYAELRIPVGSDAIAIRAAYIERAKQIHPDAASSSSSSSFSSMQGHRSGGSAFAALVEARSFLLSLSDEARRSALTDGTIVHDGMTLNGSATHDHTPVPNAAHANTIQHRTYLRNEGVGHGPDPGARDRQYNAHRLARGIGGAQDYMMEQLQKQIDSKDANTTAAELAPFGSLLAMTRATGQKGMSSTLVLEEQIKAAISQWDPQTLKDFGKPLSHLQHDSGSVVDPLEAKLNNILFREGVLPDWMELERKIRVEFAASLRELEWAWNVLVTKKQWKEGMEKRRKEHQGAEGSDTYSPTSSSSPGLHPSSGSRSSTSSSSSASFSSSSSTSVASHRSHFGPAWSLALSEFRTSLRSINSSIDAFNVTCPIKSRQRIHFSFHAEVARIEANKPDLARLKLHEEELNGGSNDDSHHHMIRARMTHLHHKIRRSKRWPKSKSLPILSTNKIAAKLNGADEEEGISAPTLKKHAAALTARESDAVDDELVIDTNDMTAAEVEALYRSLAAMSNERSSSTHADEEEAARIRRLRAHTSMPPTIVAAVLSSSALMLVTPLWLVQRNKATSEKDEVELEEG